MSDLQFGTAVIYRNAQLEGAEPILGFYAGRAQVSEGGDVIMLRLINNSWAYCHADSVRAVSGAGDWLRPPADFAEQVRAELVDWEAAGIPQPRLEAAGIPQPRLEAEGA